MSCVNTQSNSIKSIVMLSPPLKVLAYADDVCVLLHSTDDYCRLHHHLDRYGSVSNAKVNIHKTEAFSLDGRSYPEWIAFLAVQGISKWHDHSSPSPLRYLGFPLIQSFHQRRYLEQQLLQTVKSQCIIYSQRRFSIKGRVTIVNALILSKLWYVLRMVHLPTTFFRRLNSVIYQFVWHNCKPKIKYTQLCLDPKLGGLGLLDPQIQRHNLQIRWLRQVLEDNHPQSCSQPILLDHIRRFHSGNTGTRLALFFPLLRLRPAAHANNFMQNIYEAVDSFRHADTEQAKCTPATLLRLPLSAIFAMIPTDYWITRSRHKKLKVSQFFTYDHHFGCIRPLLSSDQPSSPRLVSKLSRDIHNRIIKLNQLIWPHILNQNQPLGEVDDSAFIDAFCSQPQWINYKPKPFRLSLIQRSLPSSAMPQIPTSKWSLFWKVPVSPESRSLWYRLFHRKLYSQSLLSRFDNGLTSSQCKFCSANTEDLQHLFVRCPMKWRVWIDAFNFFSPHLTFTQDDVCSILWSFQQFTFVDNIGLWTLSCCVLSVIWRAHWRFTIDGFPFINKQLVTRVILGNRNKYAKESKVRRKTSLSTSTRKRTRIKAADVHWCIDNVANLSVQTFAITFKHYDRQHCHSRYNITLDSHIPEEHRSRLQDEFETWRKIIDCTEFWRNQRRAQALAEANDNCSEAANNLLISNVQEIKSSVEKYHVPEPSPVTMTLQAPTTPVGHPGTSVPPVLATTGTPVSQSLSPSMADTLV
ncbi:hypothetical protein G6F28_009828 [Rhizopus arrhizus]|nr:hypothetical protein G6F28_009828 [Rhizopus arrhizus]